jgi:hypothetical protein
MVKFLLAWSYYALTYVIFLFISGCGGSQPDHVRTLHGPPLFTSGSIPDSSDASLLVRFNMPRNNYAITRTAIGFSVMEKTEAAAAVNITTQTTLQFSDVNINLTVGEKSKNISDDQLKTLIELYIAFFNRVPDADGMAYWMGEIKNGMSIDQLANSFYDAAIKYSELTSYSASMSNADFVKVIYKNVLGRSGTNAPPEADINYWANELASGKSTKGMLIATMLNSAHTFAGDSKWGWVPQLLDNKVSIGKYFAIEQGLNYKTPEESITKTMHIVGKITPTNLNDAYQLIDMKDLSFNLTRTTTDSSITQINHCFKINSGIVNYTMGQVNSLGFATAASRYELIPVSGLGANGKHKLNIYAVGAASGKPLITNEEELTSDGLKLLSEVNGQDGAMQTTITYLDGRRIPFDLLINEEKAIEQSIQVKTVANGAVLLNANMPQVTGVTLLDIGPLTTYGKHFPLTCKVKIRHISTNHKPDISGTYANVWFASGYGAVRIDTYSPKLTPPLSGIEVISIENAPN